MSEEKTMRLKQVATTLNISTSTVVDFLSGKGFDIENKPTSKITSEQFNMLMKAFESSLQDKNLADALNIGKKHPAPEPEPFKAREPEIIKPEPIAPAPKGETKHAIHAMRAVVQAAAEKLALPAGLLCPRRLLEEFAVTGIWPAALQGWRASVLEVELTPLLPG